MADLADQNLKKHVAAVHINNRLTLTQRKASNVLLYNAYENLLTARVHRIRVKDLAEAIGFNTNNLEPLKEALKTLARTVLEWNILDENGTHEEWGATTLLAQAVIRHGYCIYAYSPDLCEKLYRPEIYALLNLSIQRKFSSGYALALYENCLRYRRVGSTGWISLDNLKKLMGINETDAYYQDFRKFNDKVIKPAMQQVNETSDLFLEIEYQRANRKVSAVRFQVSDNPQMLLFAQQQKALEESLAQMPAQPAMSSAVEAAMRTAQDRQMEIREKLQAFGLSARQIRTVLSRYDLDHIENRIGIVEQDVTAGRVQNIPAHLLTLLRNRHDNRRDASETPPITKSDLLDSAAESPNQLSLEPEGESAYDVLTRLTATERQVLERDYVAYLEQSASFEMRLILERYQKNGLKSRMVESHFRAFINERLASRASLSA